MTRIGLYNLDQQIMQSTKIKKPVIKMKVCVVGNPLAGKTTLIHKLIQEEQNTTPTEQYEVSIYCLDTKAAFMEIQLWDCSNNHAQYHKHLRQAYFRNSSATLLVFDITQPDWEQTAHNWISEIYDNQCYLIYAIATKLQILSQDPIEQKGSFGRPLIPHSIETLKQKAINLFKKYQIRIHFMDRHEPINKHFEQLFLRMHDQSIIVSRGSIARGLQLPFMLEEDTSTSKFSKEQ